MTYFTYFLGNIEATHPGNQWSVPTCFVDELEELTCAIHGQSRFSSVDELRLQKFKEECENQSAGVVFPEILTCIATSLVQHIKMVNYQVAIWKRVHETEPEIPHPCDHGRTSQRL